MIKEIDDTKAPLLDHLLELRTRLIHSLVAIFVLFIACYIFAENIYAFLGELSQHAIKRRFNCVLRRKQLKSYLNAFSHPPGL